MGHIQRQCRDVEEWDSQAHVNHQGHREEGPGRTGLQHKRGGQEATQDDPMSGSSDDHLRQRTVEPAVIEQDMVVDTEASKVSDDRPDQRVLRLDEG